MVQSYFCERLFYVLLLLSKQHIFCFNTNHCSEVQQMTKEMGGVGVDHDKRYFHQFLSFCKNLHITPSPHPFMFTLWILWKYHPLFVALTCATPQVAR